MTDIVLAGPAIVILLGTLIFFHEFGHFGMAKLLRIRVEEFAFGFGPRWIRLFKRGDTEYTIHPIPLGGFVKMAGMQPDEEDVPDGFLRKPWWSRFLVYLAGPIMSFLLGYLVFCTLGFTVGLPITGDLMNSVDLVMPGSEAQRVGLRSGDVIVSINGERIETGREMLDVVHGSPNKQLAIVIDRDGRRILMAATPKATEVEKGKVIGLLGFAPRQKLQRIGLVESVRYGTGATVAFVGTVLKVLPSRQVKDAVGGPLAIADAAVTSVRRGAYGFLQLTAILSLGFGIINLLPIPILDGGWMMLLLAEAIRRRRLSLQTVELAARIGLTVIAVIFILVTYLDLGRIATGKMFR